MHRIGFRMGAALLALAMLVGAPGAAVAASAAGAAPTANWTKQAPLPTWYDLEGVDMVSATEGWAVGAQGTILHTTDGAATWSPQTSGTTEPLNAVRFL